MSNPLSFVFGTRPAQFRSRLSPEQALECLRAALTPRTRLTPGQPAMVGRAGMDRVWMERQVLMVHNPFKPQFRGTLHADGLGAALTGRFGISPLVRGLLAVWFGFDLLWTIATVVVALTLGDTVPHAWLFPAAGLGMLLLGGAVVALGCALARGDQPWLSQQIETALRP